MFGLFSFSSLARPAAAPVAKVIKEHPDFIQIARLSRPERPERGPEDAFQRDYGQQREIAETAARLV